MEPIGPPEEEWTPPSSFDGFEVVRPLGRGGMGRVYLGHDTLLDRPVALKFIAGGDPGRAARERFLVEARAIARLQHPNVVGIFRIGEVLGQPYLAYELVSGRSLDRIPKPFPWPKALKVGLGIARGLAAAHRRNVLHRDVKPANVMLTENGEVKLLDFGLAKLVDSHGEENGHAPAEPALLDPTVTPGTLHDLDAHLGSLTATGILFGTPLYIAPELWIGSGATPQSEIYALGLVLYELLAGQLPHGSLRGKELVHAVWERDLPSLASVSPQVPGALCEVVDRCVRRSFKARYANAEALCEALEAVRAVYHPFSDEVATASAELDHETTLVTTSFARLFPQLDRLSARFYERLFAAAPHLRPLFPAELSAQKLKFANALQLIIENLRKPERLIPMLEDLGHRHAAYGVEPAHFEVVGASLLGALADFDPMAAAGEAADAWRHAFAQIERAMVRGLQAARQAASGTVSLAVTFVAQREALIEPPRPRYAKSGDVNVAYQVIGTGPIDLVVIPGWVSHLELSWEHPASAQFLRKLASFSRLILFDKRGSGLSDRLGESATLDERMDDIRAVMEAAGSERAAIFGTSDGGALAMLFAATYPERTRALLLYGSTPRCMAAPDYPYGLSPQMLDGICEEVRTRWGEPLFIEGEAPSLAHDSTFRRYWASYLRGAASPGAAVAMFQSNASVDVRHVLSTIRVPTLVLHREEDALMPVAGARYMADHIPDARLVVLPGKDHLPYVGQTEPLLSEVQRFLATAPKGFEHSWVVGTVLAFAARGADREATAALRAIVRREVGRFRGVELDPTTEPPGTPALPVAMFDGPARAVRCALTIDAAARAGGIPVGLGLHSGECHLRQGDVTGVAAQLAPCVAAQAAAGEVLVSAAVRDLVAGSGFNWREHGRLEQEGVKESPALFQALPGA